MKRITLALLLLFSVSIVAQQGINYKAVIKDGSGVVVPSTAIDVTFIILDGAVNVYEETHSPNTDANGIVILNIGEGTPVTGTFSAIDWSSNNHFLNVQIDTGGGLQDMGTTAFKTVPYALSAKTVQNISGTTNYVPKFIDGVAVGDSQIFDDGTNVGIGTTTPSHNLEVKVDGLGFSQTTSDGTKKIGTYAGADGLYLQTHTDDALNFATNNSLAQMTLNANGNLGIGVEIATAKLDVAGAIKIADGTQGVGKILTSDASGLASWDDSVINLITALQAQITLLESQTVARVGDLRAGGVVFWVDPADDRHGLVCAMSDYVSTREWGCYGTDLPSVPNVTSFPPAGPGAEIGDGITNTNGILTDCPTAPAALAARSYGPEWFLPSAKELKEMYLNKATLEAVAAFSAFSFYYWSSTESHSNLAWVQYFDDGVQTNGGKNLTSYVRAVRAF
jgi:hypothetical protein